MVANGKKRSLEAQGDEHKLRPPERGMSVAALVAMMSSARVLQPLDDHVRPRAEAQASLAHLGEEAGGQIVLMHASFAEVSFAEETCDEDTEGDHENRAETKEASGGLELPGLESESSAQVHETCRLCKEALGKGLRLVQERRPGEAQIVLRERSYPNRTNKLRRVDW